MRFFRTLKIALSFVVFGVCSAFLNFIIFPLAKILLKKEEFIHFSSKVISSAWSMFIKYLELIKIVKVKADKEEFSNIKNKIIVSSHPSYIDILILFALMPKSTCFVKKELTKNFILKNIVKSIFIPNNLGIEEMQKEAQKFLDLGFNIIIFPMGKRHKSNEIPKIKKGAASIAISSSKNIIPIQIKTSEDFLLADESVLKGINKTVEYDITAGDEIKLEDFKSDSIIVMKRNITDKISKALFN